MLFYYLFILFLLILIPLLFLFLTSFRLFELFLEISAEFLSVGLLVVFVVCALLGIAVYVCDLSPWGVGIRILVCGVECVNLTCILVPLPIFSPYTSNIIS